MTKKTQKKRTISEVIPEEEPIEAVPAKRASDEPIPKKIKWINKQRVLVLASRGISYRDRHLMEDIKKLMPHHKTEPKMERSKTLSVINEICESKNCSKAILFEGRQKRDLYIWMANTPVGPSIKFLVENIYTMSELKLTGNCLRGSRPLLSFDTSFEDKPHHKLLKELLTQIFGVPNHHPKSQPFFDHVYTFAVLDNRIWFRNFQVLSEDGALAEVGPRFVLNPVKMFSGSFTGVPLWENAHYRSPAKLRSQYKLAGKTKYVNRQEQKLSAAARKPEKTYELSTLTDVFSGDTLEKAKLITKMEEKAAEEEGLSKQNGGIMQRTKLENLQKKKKQKEYKKQLKKSMQIPEKQKTKKIMKNKKVIASKAKKGVASKAKKGVASKAKKGVASKAKKGIASKAKKGIASKAKKVK